MRMKFLKPPYPIVFHDLAAKEFVAMHKNTEKALSANNILNI